MLAAICMAAWVVLAGRLFYLQIISYDRYKASAVDNIQRETTLTASRGLIYDRNKIQLATNKTVYRVFISTRDFKNYLDTEESVRSVREDVANILCNTLGVSYSTVMEKMGIENRADITIAKDQEEEIADLLMSAMKEYRDKYKINEYSFVYTEAVSKRYYPYGSLASHVIGVMGTDGGLMGLEYQYNTELSGIGGRYITAKNASGYRMPFKYDSYIDASDGYDLLTTIDLTTQSLLEEQLKKTYTESQAANRVCGIVMDVKTGAIRGMGVYPDFDLNDPYELDADSLALLAESGLYEGTDEYWDYYYELVYTLWRNKCVSEVYEPGSTTKIITTSMALEEGLVDFDEEFTCTGQYFVEGYNAPIHCHKLSGHGTHPYYYMLQQSCNPTLMQVAERIGSQKFYSYFQAFGYTSKTGIDLPGESLGIFHTLNGFNAVELAVYSFGQTFKTTPLQQLTAICAVANGGKLVQPHVVSALLDGDGNVAKSFDTVVKRQVISEDVCRSIAAVLEDGVSGDGGAKNAYVPGYKVAAKTGTSEVRDILDENGNSYLRVGSCVAFAPSDDPQIAVIIIVDQPMISSVYGSTVAAPYVASLLNGILPIYGVERQYTEEEQARQAVTVNNYVGWPLDEALANIAIWGLDYKVVGTVIGEDDLIVQQVPSAGEALSKENGRIVLYTGTITDDDYVTVPNLVGMTASNAQTILRRRGLNTIIEGAQNYDVGSGAVVVSQEPAEGSRLIYGSVVTIVMRYLDGTAN